MWLLKEYHEPAPTATPRGGGPFFYGIVILFSIVESEFTDNESELYKKNKEYLYKIINLTKKENIDLIIVKTPTSYNYEEMSRLNHIKRIAEENDILFLDYINNMTDLNLDYNKDFYDTGHLNKNGSIKFTNKFIENLE